MTKLLLFSGGVESTAALTTLDPTKDVALVVTHCMNGKPFPEPTNDWEFVKKIAYHYKFHHLIKYDLNYNYMVGIDSGGAPYIVNRCLSGQIDAILFANEMNLNAHLDKDMQYQFYINTLRKRKRFSPWLKKEQIADLDLVKRHYGYSNEKAKIALNLLTKTQLEILRNKYDMGGKR